MLTRSGVVVDNLDQDAQRNLTVCPADFSGMGRPSAPYALYETRPDGRVSIPPHYARESGLWDGKTTDASVTIEARPAMNFCGTLLERQVGYAEACLGALRDHGGGVLSLPTGFGKTTVALYVACQLKVKTLVLTHMKVLNAQWRDRIADFLGPGARVADLPAAGKKNKHAARHPGDFDFAIATVQSVATRNRPEEAFDGFGLLIVDEVHHIAARMFCRSMLSACCPMILGLSATPRRADGLSHVIHWFIGPLFLKVEREPGEARLSVRTFRTGFETGNKAATKPWEKAARMTALCRDPARNALLVEKISDVFGAEPNRRLIVLSERCDHCIALRDMLVATSRFGEDEVGLYMGGMKAHELEASKGRRIIVATYSQAKEGLDIPCLDTLMLATPQGNVEQAVGRILRRQTQDNDRPAPLVLDPQDGDFQFKGVLRTRYYKKLGAKIACVDDAKENSVKKQRQF